MPCSAGVLAAILLAGILLPRAARADGPHPKRNDQYKHQVEKLEQVWRTAQLTGDVAAMDGLLSDDYVGITMNGQVVTKAQQLDRMRNRNTILTKIELDDVKVKLIGNAAIVAAVVLSRAEVDGTNDGVPMHGTYRYTRVYSRSTAGVWKITNFEATRVGPERGQRGSRGGDAEPSAQPPSPQTQP